MPLSAQDVAEITRLLEQSDFLELRIEHEGLKITLKRAGAQRARSDAAAAALPVVSAEPAAATARPASADSDPSLIEVTAPLLGIFYRGVASHDRRVPRCNSTAFAGG